MTDSNMGRLLAKRYQLKICLELEQWAGLSCKGCLLGGVPVAVKFSCQSEKTSRVQERFEKRRKLRLLGQKSAHCPGDGLWRH